MPSNKDFFRNYVVLISIEGLTTQSMPAINTPILKLLTQEGAYTLKVKGHGKADEFQTLLTGSHPISTKGSVQCDTSSLDKRPTIFQVLKTQFADLPLAAIYQSQAISQLIEKDTTIYQIQKPTTEGVVEASQTTIFEKTPFFTFIQIQPPENQVKYIDTLVGEIVRALSAKDILDKTFIIVTGLPTDNQALETINLPLIVSGERIRDRAIIKRTVQIQDIAPTILHLVRAKIPDCWTGQPLVTLGY